MKKTNGFSSPLLLRRHYAKHAHKFGIADIAEYERRADSFLGDAKLPHVLECKRKRGDILRFNPHTEEYGVIDNAGIIRTYFRPAPCASIPATLRVVVKQAGECHEHTDNISYFRSECARH